MDHRIVAVASCIAVAVLSGCAMTTERIDIRYNQQQGVSQIPGASIVSVNVRVNDQRQDKSKVSSKKNGYGMEMAPVLANEDIVITIRRAMEQELRARGFQLGADAALIQITGDLTRFYNDHKVGFFSADAVADFAMTVLVRSKKGDLLYSGHVNAQGTEANSLTMGADNARLALNMALENGMKNLFEDQAFLAALTTSSR